MTDDTDSTLRALVDAEVPEMTDEAFVDIRNRLIDEMAKEPEPSPAPEPSAPGIVRLLDHRRRRNPARLRWLAAAAVALAVTAGVVVATSVSDRGTTVPVTSDAQSVLEAAADNIQPDMPLQPGQYRYVRDQQWEMPTGVPLNDGKYHWLAESTREKWVPADLSAEWLWRVTYTGQRKWLNGTEEQGQAAGIDFEEFHYNEGDITAACGATGFLGEPGGDRCQVGWRRPTAEWARNITDDPAEFLALLREQGRQDWEARPRENQLDDYVLSSSVHILRADVFPAEMRATTFRALALLPGIEVVDEDVALDGRHGTALALELPAEPEKPEITVDENGVELPHIVERPDRFEIVIDWHTGQIVGHRTVRVVSVDEEIHGWHQYDLPLGTVTGYTSMAPPAVVDEMGQRPSK